MESHPVAQIFPMMQPAEFEELCNDIKANGLREEIWTFQGKIVDGRNRYKACRETGAEPRFREWDGKGSLTQFVVSLNLHRRHLSTSQRSVIALEILPLLEAEAKERQRSAGRIYGESHPKKEVSPDPGEALQAAKKATVKAAYIVGVGKTSVENAKAIAKVAPEKIEEIREGEKTVDAAYREIKQKQVVMKQEPPKGGNVAPMRDMNKEPFSTARQFSTIAISQLTRIKEDDPQRVAALMEVRDYIDAQLNPLKGVKTP